MECHHGVAGNPPRVLWAVRDVWVRSVPGPEQPLLWKEAQQPLSSSSVLLPALDLSGSGDATFAALGSVNHTLETFSRGAREITLSPNHTSQGSTSPCYCEPSLHRGCSDLALKANFQASLVKSFNVPCNAFNFGPFCF